MTPQEEDLLIEAEFQDVLQGYLKSNHRKKVEIIERAFRFAKKAHGGIRRRSGEPYILHPIAVAKIASQEIGLGSTSICAALLHDVVEDTDYTVEDIEQQFGKKIAELVSGLTKISGGIFGDKASAQAENFRKLLLTMSRDIRVVLIKMADRLHNMRTLGAMPVDKQMKIAGETIYLFAPLAHRLGLYNIKTELENLSLKYSFPNDYRQIVDKLSETELSRSMFIEKFNAPIIEKLKESGIDFTIKGRIKSVYSIWKKMQRKTVTIDEIYDLFAIRIVFKPIAFVPEKTQCWNIYSLITDLYKPKPDRIRDWVNIPKANGYEALHCTVMGPDGVWAEVQIRSERMDEIAEKGFAAHWKYKERENREGELDKWIREVQNALNSPTEDAVEFLDEFKLNLYTSEVVVFTPKGESVTMPKGAVVLDFAYEIHSSLGDRAIGAKINHKIESLYTPINNGDQVEIITSATAHPVLESLNHVVTAKAKQKIKTFLKKERENNLSNGIRIFEEEMKKRGVTPSARVFHKLLPAYNSSSKDEFYVKLGAGIISLDNVDKILRENAAIKLVKYWTLQVSNTLKFFGGSSKESASGQVSPAEDIKIATCCMPIPGDEVIGFRRDDGNVTVHKKSCDEAIKLAARHGDQIVPIKWSSEKIVSFLSVIEVRGIDRMGILRDISKVITGDLDINIRKLSIESHDGIFEGSITLYVKDKKDLTNVMDKVLAIKGIESVKRLESEDSQHHGPTS